MYLSLHRLHKNSQGRYANIFGRVHHTTSIGILSSPIAKSSDIQNLWKWYGTRNRVCLVDKIIRHTAIVNETPFFAMHRRIVWISDVQYDFSMQSACGVRFR